jgi:2-keto-4-pentenoate hydratase/2-oxohepta-3-ene-1,7-dioic acid hydratase in catechol pathway
MKQQTTRRDILNIGLAAGLVSSSAPAQTGAVVKYVRYEFGGRAAYGVLEGDIVHELRGGLFDKPARTGVKRKLADVRLLVPCEPRQVLAAGLNYKSHIGNRPPPAKPEFFWKSPGCLVEHGAKIIIPADARNVHYEGELVVVVGRRTRNVSVAEAPACVFGVTCGNDVSERDWQRNDLQWWRAKASDTFGPLGPAIVTGLHYGNLRLETRVNGQVKQSENTKDLLFDVPTMISFLSKHLTLWPGDVLYTGTPQTTSPMKPGDVVEVEVEGVGILRNTVA